MVCTHDLHHISLVLKLPQCFKGSICDLVLHPSIAQAAFILLVTRIDNIHTMLMQAITCISALSAFVFLLMCIPLIPGPCICYLSSFFADQADFDVFSS